MNRKVSFTNKNGETLAGIIDLPEGDPAFYAVFSPCFTCVKETHGAVKISRALVARGGAVLRFDTAGVGQSAGTLARTNFSTRIDDIVSACEFMDTNGMTPRLLIGHSISGPAAICAANLLPFVEVVATIGSPSDPQDMLRRFAERREINVTDTTVELNVLGHINIFDRSFLDDLNAQDVATETARFTGTLLSFHAPNDNIVDIANMQRMQDSAVSARVREAITMSDGATHLFETRNGDEEAVAEKLMQFL